MFDDCLLNIKNIQSELIAHYPFDGNANDDTGNGNDGTVIGATLTTDRYGNADSAYNFDGINDRISCGNDNMLNIGNSDYTITMWAEATGTGLLSDCALIKGAFGSGGKGYGVAIDSNEATSFVDDDILRQTITESYVSGGWHFIISERKNNILSVSVDLEEAETIDISDVEDVDNSNNLIIGSSQLTNGTASSFYKGKLDDIRIYSGTLTPSEKLSLYNE